VTSQGLRATFDVTFVCELPSTDNQRPASCDSASLSVLVDKLSYSLPACPHPFFLEEFRYNGGP